MNNDMGNRRWQEKSTLFSWRRIWFGVTVVVVLIGVGMGTLVLYAASYTDRVLPGLFVGDVAVGGLSEPELREYLETMSDKLAQSGMLFLIEVDGQRKEFTLYPVLVVEDTPIELVHIDVDQAVAALIGYGKEGDLLTRTKQIVQAKTVAVPFPLAAYVWVNESRVKSELSALFARYEQIPRNANLHIETLEPLVVTVVSSSPGIVFVYDNVPEQIQQAWGRLEVPEIEVSAEFQAPVITEARLGPLISRVPAVFDQGELQLTYTNPHTKQVRTWRLTPEQFQQWLTVEEGGANTVVVALDRAALGSYIASTITKEVTVPARNARFRMDQEKNKVIEFQGSRPGVTLDIETALTLINQALGQRLRHGEGAVSAVQLPVQQTEPDITTAEVNDLGIREVLGVGVSNFKGSPPNRIANIRLAAQKLNGVIVQPGQEFSTNKFAGPYEIENGYLPEKVIVGDRIKLGVGGGMCQISTTLFRMAMNSGMPITERTNHGLVVNYYNDPANKNPGTDATVFEPLLDFKFLNDTQHAILVQTEVDLVKQELIFTIWGANDGRSGSYTPPQVTKWIQPGEEKIIATTELPTGKKECQSAYIGADAHFTYRRVAPDGSVHERVFKSRYRPLPKICLVGVVGVASSSPSGEIICAPGDDACRIRQAAEAAAVAEGR